MLFRFLLLILLPWGLFGQTLELKSSMEGISGADFIQIYEDQTHKITIEQIENMPFKTQQNGITGHGPTSSVWWLRLKVRNSNNNELSWKIKLMFGLFDDVEVWQFSNSSLVKYQIKGDHNINPSEISYKNRSVYSFITKANSDNEIYFKISFKNSGVAELFATIWSPDSLDSYLEKNIYMLIAIFAGLFVLLFYNLFILLVLKSKIYFLYILYLCGVMLIIVTFNQIGAHYIWNNSIFLIDFMPIFAFIVVNISFLLFSRAFLETSKRLKTINTYIIIMLVINILALLLAIIGLRLIAIKIVYITSFSFFFFPFFGAYLWNKGFIIARGYTIASSILSITITIALLRATGFIPTSEFLYWLWRIGFIVEGVLLAIALADRINLIQRSYTQSQKNLNRSLEKKVKIRTKQLEEYQNHLEKKVQQEIEKREEKEKILLQQSKLAAMGEMMDAVAHQWKQPINIINMQVDMLGYDFKDGIVNQEHIEKLQKNVFTQVKHMTDTLNEFRSFFRPNKGSEEFDIKTMIEKVLVLIQDEFIKNQIQITINGIQNFTIIGIENEFKHLILNILNNSKDAFNDNNIKNREIKINILSDKTDKSIEIIDNAGGIPENIIVDIFKANITTKNEEKGTGIGLYMSSQIATKHHGTLEVENVKDGAKFIFKTTVELQKIT